MYSKAGYALRVKTKTPSHTHSATMYATTVAIQYCDLCSMASTRNAKAITIPGSTRSPRPIILQLFSTGLFPPIWGHSSFIGRSSPVATATITLSPKKQEEQKTQNMSQKNARPRRSTATLSDDNLKAFININTIKIPIKLFKIQYLVYKQLPTIITAIINDVIQLYPISPNLGIFAVSCKNGTIRKNSPSNRVMAVQALIEINMDNAILAQQSRKKISTREIEPHTRNSTACRGCSSLCSSSSNTSSLLTYYDAKNTTAIAITMSESDPQSNRVIFSASHIFIYDIEYFKFESSSVINVRCRCKRDQSASQ